MSKKGRDTNRMHKGDKMNIDGASDDSGSGSASRHDAKKAKVDDPAAAVVGGSDAPASAADIAALIQTVNRRFDALSIGITKQGEKIGHLSGAFSALEGNLAKFQDKTNSDIAKLEAKLQEQSRAFSEQINIIQQKLETPKVITSSPASASATAASGIASPSTAAPSLASSASVDAAHGQHRSGTGHYDNRIPDSQKVLVLGLPRELPRPAHFRIIEEIRPDAPDDMLANIKVHSNGNKVFIITFPAAGAARRFAAWANDRGIEWDDPRNGAMVPLKFIIPRPPDDRARGRALQEAWKLVNAHITSSTHRHITPDMKVITDTTRGRLSVQTDTDKWTLFFTEAKPDGDGFLILYNPAQLSYLGMTVADATKVGAQPASTA
jgi:hypothetical protein